MNNVHAMRRRSINIFVMRDWQLPCDDCGHVGELRATARQVRRWVAAGKLHCTECGSIKQPAQQYYPQFR